ncbi:MAG TPA: lipid-A-disaccharide synthase [Bdellovibrionales bacterium]|nr:lipid-A-disaccharide synthase [Bdellovibrionales bacterium]
MSSSTPRESSILIIAAEESSAHYGLRLLEHWKKSGRKVRAYGVGNRAMEAAGFEIMGYAEDLAVFGLFEIWTHWPKIKEAFHKVVEAARTRKPDVILLMDYPGFNFRFTRKIKSLGIPIVYFIPPQVWAWKQGRVKFLREMIDENLVLFPFEESFYKSHDVPVQFVGHPLLDEMKPELFEAENQRLNRRRFGIADDKVVLGLMPGSRQSELKMNLETQIETAKRLKSEIPNLSVVLLVAPNLSKDELARRLPSDTGVPITMVKGEPFEMIGMADAILCASGTATLMVGLMEKPMVIMYRMNPISAALAKRLVKSKFFGLANLVMEREVAPERFQGDANPVHLASLLKPLLTDSRLRGEKAGELREIKTKLGAKGAIGRLAARLDKYLQGTND